MLGRRAEGQIERRLREERPEPRAELVERLSEEIGAGHRRPVSARFRIAVAVAVALVTAAALAASGGLGYASGALGHVTASVSDTFGALVHQAPAGSDSSASSNVVAVANAQYTSAGYYCFRKPTTAVPRKGYLYLNPEPYVQNQAQYNSYTGSGWQFFRYDNGTQKPCNPGKA